MTVQVVGRIGISPNRSSFRLGTLRTHLAAAAFVARVARDRGAQPVLLVRIDDTNRNLASAVHEAPLLAQLTEVARIPLDRLGRDCGVWLVRQSERVNRYRAVVNELSGRGLALVFPDGSAVVRPVGSDLVPLAPGGGPGPDAIRVLRSGGAPLWHLASAVDDHDYRVDVCVRGVDKQSAEPVQTAIARALGGRPPAFHYQPKMVAETGPDTVEALRTDGFRDAALFAYVASSLVRDPAVRLSFDDLVDGIAVRSDPRSTIRFDRARLAKLDRQVPALLDEATLAADLRAYCRRIGDTVTAEYLHRYPVAALLAAHPRHLHDHYGLVSGLAHRRFEPDVDHPARAAGVAPTLRRSVADAEALLARQGLDGPASTRLLRWMLCGRVSGPDPAVLWHWHRTAGTLDRQLGACPVASGP